MLDIKTLERPKSPEEAVRVFAEAEGGGLYVAGGTIVMPAASPNLNYLVDLTGTGLSYIREASGEAGREIAIGAMTRVAELATDPLIGGAAGGLLRHAALAVATHTVRNRATVGGNLIVAGFPTDLPTALLALDASVVVQDAEGRRLVELEAFYERRSEVFRKGDLVVEIRVPLLDTRPSGAFEKIGRKRVDVAVVNCAVRLERSGARKRSARVALGGIGPSPVRLRSAEAILDGGGAGPGVFAEAAGLAAAELDPRSDHRASGDYRRKVAAVLVRRALKRAVGLDWE